MGTQPVQNVLYVCEVTKFINERKRKGMQRRNKGKRKYCNCWYYDEEGECKGEEEQIYNNLNK